MSSAKVLDACLSSYKYIFRNDLLRDQVAFISGGGSGIGFTIAEIFMRHGCSVAIGSRNLERLTDAAQRLESATKGKCIPLAMDVRKPDEVISAMEQTLAKLGKINILVNSAAGNFLSPLAGLSYNAYKNVIDIDTVGTFNCSKTVFEKYMKDHGGAIINITATLSHTGTPMQAHAGSAKAAIDALTKHMAVEWGQNGVRVVGVAPGVTGDTEGFRKLKGNITEEQIAQTIPIKRIGTKLEVAHTVLFAVSEAGSYITGETIITDGGHWLVGAQGFLYQTGMMDKMISKGKL